MHPAVRYSILYGALAGSVIIATLLVGIGFADHLKFLGTEWFGYLLMLIALTFLFVGMKRYRDVERGGILGFGAGLALGLGIALVAGIVYVIVWEIYLAATHYRFMDEYVAGILRRRRAEGLSGAALARETARLEAMRVGYRNPLVRIPMTFLEIFPVGVVVALVSAALLRNPKFLRAAR